MKRPAVFLDRDGTINREVSYLSRPQDVEILPGAAEAIARLNAAGFWVVVISNQSGLARGYFDEGDLALVQLEINRRLKAAGARVDAWYFCPHHPAGVVEDLALACECRKPGIGLIMQAAREIALTLEGSFMVGDRLLDVACGRRAGLTSILVKSGHPDWPPEVPEQEPHFVAADLAAAVDWILAGGGR
ncbi:MAG: HAD family hydrolase [Desulfarculus sp.]|nr:HAD family hydrolase [Desulfarculus sp.]